MPKGFDNASKDYDRAFTFTKIGKAQRDRVYFFIDSIILKSKKLSILEINCGTGEDAIKFAKLGHNVLATDASEEMIKVAKSKTNMNNLIFDVLDINLMHTYNFNQKFDLVFSNFGGLNCLSKEQLDIFFKTIVSLLTSRGKLVLVIMPRKCLWEKLYFFLKGNIQNAKRRNTDFPIAVNVHGVSINTWYYNPKEIISLTEKLFAIKNIKPIGISIPPSYLENTFLTKSFILKLLIALENILGFEVLAKYADHFIIELEKR